MSFPIGGRLSNYSVIAARSASEGWLVVSSSTSPKAPLTIGGAIDHA